MSDSEGVLFYGYCWPKDDEGGMYSDFDDEIDPAVKQLLIDRGLAPNPPARPIEKTNREQWDRWRSEHWQPWRDNYERALADLGVDWGRSGSWEYPAPYLYIRGSRQQAEWGDSQPIGFRVTDRAWKDTLDRFLASRNIDPPTGPNQPGWWLTSFYG